MKQKEAYLQFRLTMIAKNKAIYPYLPTISQNVKQLKLEQEKMTFSNYLRSSITALMVG